MDFNNAVKTCYPKFHKAYKLFEQLPLSQRSLLIKACQAQTVPQDPSTTLYKLLSQTAVFNYRNQFHAVPLREIFAIIEKSPNDPMQSAILLDILRGCPATDQDMTAFRTQGWIKEIDLSHTPNTCTIDFSFFFDLNANANPPHPYIPDNPFSRIKIANVFRQLRQFLTEFKPTIYARYTHKNMSYSTRRAFERSTRSSLDDVPIFGQDDWIRHYHNTGEQLEGSIEMRQKWYPSNAKPRTYFAQGGTAYQSSRYLQDFFTLLVNSFPSTNHLTRLQPYRLRVPVFNYEQSHYLIYDLSSFTSNMQAQRNFCQALRDFFADVEVEIFDEVYGLVTITMGELLDDYNEHCVFNPVLNQERVPRDLRTDSDDYIHECASMLGIYGNLMTCTVAHFLLVSQNVEDPFKDNNTAGDDGAINYFLFTFYACLLSISLVGLFAMDKTFKSQESGAIALKRPLEEIIDPSGKTALMLHENIVPPNLVVSISYCLGYELDPRYQLFYGDTVDHISDRISVIGKDLMRFLDSAQQMNYDHELLYETFNGFSNMVQSITGIYPSTGLSVEGRDIMWPVDPATYAFLVHDPFLVYCTLTLEYAEEFDKRLQQPFTYGALRQAGDEIECNSNKWLKHMEMLGYLEKERLTEHKFGIDAINHLYLIFRRKSVLEPVLNRYTVLKDIPLYLIV